MWVGPNGDNVINFEVVLASDDIVTTPGPMKNADENHDL